MTPPRILYVDFAPSPGGSILSLSQILEALPRQRYQPLVALSPTVAALPSMQALDLVLVSFDAGQGTAIPFRSGTQHVRSSAIAGRLRSSKWLGYPWRWGSSARRLWLRSRRSAAFIAGVVEKHGVDLLHMNDAIPLAEPGILAARRKRKPSIVTARSFTQLDDFHRLISRWPAAGVFTSRAIQDDHHAQGVRFRRERIIANAIDLRRFEQTPDRVGVRAELGLSEEVRLVTTVGRIMQRKGFDVFIRAMADVLADHADVCALIVGDVEITDVGLDAELRRLASDLGVGDRILFPGFRNDIPRILLASDLLCFVPTEAEPFGRILIEGMAAGLPVVGARSGAIPDILIEGETGLLVPPADPVAQAAAIRTLLDTPQRAAQMGQAGRRRAARLFSIEQQVDQLCQLYDEVLAASSS